MTLQNKKPAGVQTWKALKKECSKDFSHIDIKELCYQRLQALKQAFKQRESASNNANKFYRYPLDLGWNDESLRQHFFRGLRSEVMDKVVLPAHFTDLYTLIGRRMKWVNLLYQGRKDCNNNGGKKPSNWHPTGRDFKYGKRTAAWRHVARMTGQSFSTGVPPLYFRPLFAFGIDIDAIC